MLGGFRRGFGIRRGGLHVRVMGRMRMRMSMNMNMSIDDDDDDLYELLSEQRAASNR